MIKLKGEHKSHAQKTMMKALGGGGSHMAKRLGMPSAGPRDGAAERDAPMIRGKTEPQRTGGPDGSSDSELDSDLEDDDIGAIRAKRMAELQTQAKKQGEFRSLGHGEYSEITEEQFLPTVTKSKFAIVHFYSNDFQRCKIVDKHLRILASLPKYLPTKFATLDATKSPFFVAKLKIRTLPTIVCFKNGVAIDRVVGFDELGGTDEFPTQALERRLQQAGVIVDPRANVQPTGPSNSIRRAARRVVNDWDSD